LLILGFRICLLKMHCSPDSDCYDVFTGPETNRTGLNPLYAPFFNAMGVTSAMVLTSVGSAYGILKAGSGVAMMSIVRPDLAIRGKLCKKNSILRVKS